MGGLVLTLLIVAGLVVVHETGHVLAGLAVGIPRSAMKIDFGVPVSEVVLWDDQGRIDPRDRARFRRLVRTPRHDFVFTVGGIVVQTAAVVAVAVVLAPFATTHRLGARTVWASLLMLLGYLVLDIVLTWRTRRPRGDASSLWRLSRTATVASLAAVGAVHVCLVYLLG